MWLAFSVSTLVLRKPQDSFGEFLYSYFIFFFLLTVSFCFPLKCTILCCFFVGMWFFFFLVKIGNLYLMMPWLCGDQLLPKVRCLCHWFAFQVASGPRTSVTCRLVFSGPAPPQCAQHHFLTFPHIQFPVGNLIFDVWDSERGKRERWTGTETERPQSSKAFGGYPLGQWGVLATLCCYD